MKNIACLSSFYPNNCKVLLLFKEEANIAFYDISLLYLQHLLHNLFLTEAPIHRLLKLIVLQNIHLYTQMENTISAISVYLHRTNNQLHPCK